MSQGVIKSTLRTETEVCRVGSPYRVTGNRSSRGVFLQGYSEGVIQGTRLLLHHIQPNCHVWWTFSRVCFMSTGIGTALLAYQHMYHFTDICYQYEGLQSIEIFG